MEFILNAVLALGAIALVASVLLFVISKKFAVKEDPRIAQVAELLPGANCGGCGFPGCSGMADALVKGADAGSIEALRCPVGGDVVMNQVADLLGMAMANSEPMVAVVRCNGSCENRPRIAVYDGLQTCAAMNSTGAGETGCGFGCLGCGDCTNACQFGAIRMNAETGLPEVDEEKCTSCGACVKACPRHIIELRKKGPKGRRVYVQCVNKDDYKAKEQGIYEIIDKHPGNSPVTICLKEEHQSKNLGRQFSLQADEVAIEELKQLLGEGKVLCRTEKWNTGR